MRSLLVLAAVLILTACSEPVDTTAKGGDPSAALAATPSVDMPADAPPQEEIDPAMTPVEGATPSEGGTCLSEIGEAASARLVQRCIQVSPATRPPCNKANPCAMIQGEIDRSCGQYGADEIKPEACAA